MLRYFGPPRSVSVRSGCRRPTNPRISPLWMIGKHDAVAEPVDETAGAGDGGHAGGDHLLVGDSAAAEVVDQSGPAGRGLAGPEARVIGQVLTEPVGEVGLSPRRRELAAEVAQAPSG